MSTLNIYDGNMITQLLLYFIYEKLKKNIGTNKFFKKILEHYYQLQKHIHPHVY